jgi:hypothetical protein
MDFLQQVEHRLLLPYFGIGFADLFDGDLAADDDAARKKNKNDRGNPELQPDTNLEFGQGNASTQLRIRNTGDRVACSGLAGVFPAKVMLRFNAYSICLGGNAERGPLYGPLYFVLLTY